jgi:hypothetical protein
MFLFESTLDFMDLGNGADSIVSTKMSRLWNVTLLDNKDGIANSHYPAHLTREMVAVEDGCELLLENVTIVGRVYNNKTTSYAIQTVSHVGALPLNTPTILHVNKCYIDGVTYAIKFNPAQYPELGELRVENTRARTYHSTINLGMENTGTFIQTIIGKIFINNNYYLGLTPFGSAVTSGTFLLLLTQDTAVSRGFVTLIGNKGNTENVNNPSGDIGYSRRNWIKDNRAVKWAFNLSEIGNSWGAVNSNDWFITIGDGVHSSGDFTGVNALELVNSLNSESSPYLIGLSGFMEQRIIINPGTYDVDSILHLGKLFGNVTASSVLLDERQVIVRLNSLLPYSSSNVHTIGQAENIEFVATNTLKYIKCGCFHFSAESQIYNVLTNVKFTNCQVEVINKSMAVIRNCIFEQTGVFADDAIDLISDADVTDVSNCIFSGYGYGLRVRFNLTNAIVSLTNCIFNLTGIRNTSATSYNQRNYIYIIAEKIFINNIKVNSPQTLVPIGMLNTLANRYQYHIILNASDSLTIENSYISGPDQKGLLATSFYHSIVCCALYSDNLLKLTNNEIVGGVPVYIGGFDAHIGAGTFGGNIDIQNNNIHHYEAPTDGVTNAVVIQIYDAGYSNYAVLGVPDELNRQVSLSNINISNNKITGYIKGLLSCALDANATVQAGGLLSVTALGWNVNITNNDINYFSDDNFSLTSASNLTTAIKPYCLSSLYVNNRLTADVYAIVKINNNNIIHRNASDDKVSRKACVFSKHRIGIINNNVMLTWFNTEVSSSGRYYIFENSEDNGNLICGNSFTFNSDIIDSVIYAVGTGYGIITSNWMDLNNDPVNYTVSGSNASSWIVTSDNYGIFDMDEIPRTP